MKINYQLELDNKIKELVEKNETPKLLLHACCGPCSTYCLEYLSKYFEITIYFYNPNIDTREEFEKRCEEIIRLINEMEVINKVNYVIEEYNNDEFNEIAQGHVEDKEGGARCTLCYEQRLRKTAKYALENNFDYFTTTLSISPYKDSSKLNNIGFKLENELNIKYLQADFKKNNGYKRSIELSKEYNLYRQDYCGCIYSKKEHDERIKKKDDQLKSNKKFKTIILLILLILIPLISIPTYSFGKRAIDSKFIINIEESKAEINEIYIYGRNLNIKGQLEIDNLEFEKVSLFFKSDNEFYSDINYTYENSIIKFNAAKYINDGINLENFDIGKYKIYLAVQSNETIKYYNLENKTKYKETNYYSMTENNKKIAITSNETLLLDVKENKEKIYDIVIDPGHGGKDSGACSMGKCETDYTLMLSKLLKKKLEKEGFKVALTRTNNDTIETYGKNSRTGLAYEKHAKFLISIHLNAGPNFSGYEIYTPYNINYVFADALKARIDAIGMNVSPNTFNKVKEGIYTRTMSPADLLNFIKDAEENNYEKYPVTSTTNYYYMIREVGGYMTGAYTDGRQDDGNNPYVDSNVGAESYILELGYITNLNDVNFINKNKDKYIDIVSETIIEYLQ